MFKKIVVKGSNYDMGFESIIKKKFGEIIEVSKIFERNDDVIYNKGYKPLYMLSIKELYSVVPLVKSNISKRHVPNSYKISLQTSSATPQNNISFNKKTCSKRSKLAIIDMLQTNISYTNIKKIKEKTQDEFSFI